MLPSYRDRIKIWPLGGAAEGRHSRIFIQRVWSTSPCYCGLHLSMLS